MRDKQRQDKVSETTFFAEHAKAGPYNVFTDASNRKLIESCVGLAVPQRGTLVIDLGCGSGVFTSVLRDLGYRSAGLDLSHSLTALGRKTWPDLSFITGDIESLPFASGTLDAVLLSGVIHHFPDVRACAQEVARVLRPGGVFFAFDPNRGNPFMYLYRDPDSPLYSHKGVTENERPIVAAEVSRVFTEAGFRVKTDYLSGLSYRYVASPVMRLILPLYNALDSLLFQPASLRRFRSFVITAGTKI